MAFKMKGPGLPGYRKRQNTGFYKTNPFESQRSPIMQTDGGTTPGYDEHGFTDEEISEMQQNYMDLKKEGKDIKWDNFYADKIRSKQETINRELKIAQIPGGGTGISWREKWETMPQDFRDQYGNIDNFIKAGEEWNQKNPKLVALLNQTKSPNDVTPDIRDDVEVTNHRISLKRKGIGQHTVDQDQNDGSYRYHASVSGHLNHIGMGSLSAADIQEGIMSGKWKYETSLNGKATGDLLMTRDYYENVHKPKIEMYETGIKNRQEYIEQNKSITNSQSIANYADQMMKENHSDVRENNVLGKRRKEYNDLRNNYIRQYRADNKAAFDDRKCGYCSTKNDPANYGHILPMIIPDDEGQVLHGREQVILQSDYMLNEETGRYELKPDARTVPEDVWNEMSPQEKNEHNLKYDVKHPKYKKQPVGYTMDDEVWLAGPTPYHQMKYYMDKYNNMSDEEKESAEGTELYADLNYAYATRQKDRDVAERYGNVETDYESPKE